ncbi:GTP-binding DUF697 domain-containing protein [Acidobacteria bacterium AH-259-A15]|nr:GTP-binding DUF697 domain-containing protein [Acidobacteria bacterium AH-259-A15]
MESVDIPTSRRDVFVNLRGWVPAELVGFLDQILVLLPDELKYHLKEVIDSLPLEGDHMQKVLELVRSQWRDIQSQDWVQIVVVGPARTGKSSLVRAMSRKQADASQGIFAIVDVQGLDEYLGYEPDRSVPEELQHADLVLLILDAQYGVADSTVQMYERLKSLDKPMRVVLNKMDLVESPGLSVREAGRRLATNVLGVSAVQPETIDRLLRAAVATSPKTLYPLTQNFPEFRRSICNGIVTQAACATAVVGAIPIPVSDLLPITAIQTGMLLKIARAFGYRLNRERARELLPMLAAGAAVREGSHRLRCRFPEYRKLIAVLIAGIWTFVLGQAAIQYFEKFPNFFNRDYAIGREN